MQLVVDPAGGVRCLYDETLPLAEFGRLTIARGSHVEPTETGHWTADLSPVSGPLLGPFATRSAALTAEREWLEANWLTTDETRIEHGPGDALPSVIRV